jgi:phosphatidylglycerophosphate synthase
MIGLILILRGNLGSGIGLVVVGRLADILDGIVAEATKTKSPVGEAVDATIDKIVAFAALTVLTFVGLVPLFVGVLFLIHNVVTIGIFGLARLKGGGLHPNTLGKISTAGEWIVVTGFTAVYAFGPQTPLFDTLKVGLYLLSGAIFVLAVISIMAYMRQAFRVSHD